MDEVSKLCFSRLRGMAAKIAVDRPSRNWGERMTQAVDSLEKQGISPDAAIDVFLFALHLADAMEPKRIAREKAQKAGKASRFGYEILEVEAVRLFTAGSWKSRKKAAQAIFPKIQDYANAKSLTRLSVESGEETVYRWLSRYQKTTL